MRLWYSLSYIRKFRIDMILDPILLLCIDFELIAFGILFFFSYWFWINIDSRSYSTFHIDFELILFMILFFFFVLISNWYCLGSYSSFSNWYCLWTYSSFSYGFRIDIVGYHILLFRCCLSWSFSFESYLTKGFDV